MTFDDDMIRLRFADTDLTIPCKALGIDWPPSETIELYGVAYQRVRLSKFSDEERSAMTNIIRGALYEVIP